MFLINSTVSNSINLSHMYFKKIYLAELQHTINQPLSAVLNYINGCLYFFKNSRNPYSSSDIINALEKAGCETERIGKILKTFSLPSYQGSELLEIHEVNINDMLTELAHDLKQTLEKLDVNVQLRLTDNLELASMNEQYQNTLRWMIISVIDLLTIDKSQLTLVFITEQGHGQIIMKIIINEQEVFTFSILIGGNG